MLYNHALVSKIMISVSQILPKSPFHFIWFHKYGQMQKPEKWEWTPEHPLYINLQFHKNIIKSTPSFPMWTDFHLLFKLFRYCSNPYFLVVAFGCITETIRLSYSPVNCKNLIKLSQLSSSDKQKRQCFYECLWLCPWLNSLASHSWHDDKYHLPIQ